MAKPLRKRPADRNLRAEILSASQKIVLEAGFSAFSMRQVASAIGYSATTLYLHFKNREEIVAELGREALAQLIAELKSIDVNLPPRERLHALGTAYVRFSSEHPGSYRLIFMESSALADAIFRGRDGQETTNAGADAFAYFVRAFEDLEKQSPPTRQSGAPASNAEIFWTSLHGIASLKITCGKFLRTDPNELLRRAIDALMIGLRA